MRALQVWPPLTSVKTISAGTEGFHAKTAHVSRRERKKKGVSGSRYIRSVGKNEDRETAYAHDKLM